MGDKFAEKELRNFIDLKLKDPKFLQALYKEMRVTYTKEQIEKFDSEDIYKVIIKHDLLENLIKTGFDDEKGREKVEEDYYTQDPNIPLNNINLKVSVVEGKGFTDFMDNSKPKSRLIVSLSFLRNRKITKPVFGSLTPTFDQTFMLGFGGLFEATQSTFDYLLKLKSNISIALLEMDTVTGQKTLLSEKEVEWRFVLVHKSLTMNLEMPNVNPVKGAVGILKVNFQLITKNGGNIKLEELALDAQIDQEKKTNAIRVKKFYDFTQTWYNEYKSVRPEFAQRAVKIYAKDSFGVHKPVFNYVTKLRTRGIDSVEYAARFVSLIPFKKATETAFDQDMNIWRNVHSFLAEGRGAAHDHALLLCNLFLGFGLDAYVVIGSCTDGAHCWVLTRCVEKVTQLNQRRERSKRCRTSSGRA